MAETNTVKTHRHITLVRITDGGSVSYDIPLRGDLSYTPGGYNLIDIKDYDGSFTGVSPTRGEENPTTFSINATQRGLAGRALEADMGLADFLNNSGVAAQGTATSQGTEDGSVAGEHEVMFDVAVTITDETGTETLTFPDVTFTGSSYSAGLDGVKIAISGTSRQAYPTVSFA